MRASISSPRRPPAPKPWQRRSLEPIQAEVGGVEAREELEIGSSLDLDTGLPGQDDAFSFNDEAFQELIAVPLPVAGQAAAAESTVAILPDSDDLQGAPAFATELVEPEPAAPGEDLFSIDAAPIGPREGAEREPQGETALFGDDLSLSTDTIDLAQATVLDPGSASGFDVSSSELGDSFAGEQAAAPAMPIDIAGPTDALRPAASGEPAAATHVSDASRAAVDAVVPKLREQLHDTLEKVAWESFRKHYRGDRPPGRGPRRSGRLGGDPPARRDLDPRRDPQDEGRGVARDTPRARPLPA